MVSPPYSTGMNKGGDRFVVVVLDREKLKLTEWKLTVYVCVYIKNYYFLTFSVLQLIFLIYIKATNKTHSFLLK